MKTRLAIGMAALVILALPTQSISAPKDSFPKIINTLSGSQPEGFTIGRGTSAFNGSPDGSIYKFDLRTGQGDIFVPVQDPEGCSVLGMRVDPRTNYLFVAGCLGSNAYVYDADSGALVMEYQLGPPGESIVNDIAITKKAVYFTDSFRPVIYRLPLSRNGALPLDSGAATEILLPDEFAIDPDVFCCGANGIVATRNGKTLIVGHSNLTRLYRVNPDSGQVDAIVLDEPLVGFLDGIVMRGRTLYIITPNDPTPVDGIQVVRLDRDMLTGQRLETITDPDLDGVASGAIFGNSLYVNNARYGIFPPQPDTEYWVTKVKIKRSRHNSD